MEDNIGFLDRSIESKGQKALTGAAFRFPTRVHPDTQKVFRFLLSAFIRRLGRTFRFLLYPLRKLEKPPGFLSQMEWVVVAH
ncbi:hypothetical protein G5I_02776 [Acromyrmex echinatior]|uniref:Uncharacterized protein n=1 Tax=Acromyrmex echinatior TaxID=103372 RepID=F4WB74_ACREC|nr:hypothetical protein G5I_02776 [Acromyrmex echinatior]